MKSLVEFIAEACCKGCKSKKFDKNILKKKKFNHLSFNELKKQIKESLINESDDETYYEDFEDDAATFLYNMMDNEEISQEQLQDFIDSDGEGEVWEWLVEDLCNDRYGAYNGEYSEYELEDDDMCRGIAVRIASDIFDEYFG